MPPIDPHSQARFPKRSIRIKAQSAPRRSTVLAAEECWFSMDPTQDLVRVLHKLLVKMQERWDSGPLRWHRSTSTLVNSQHVLRQQSLLRVHTKENPLTTLAILLHGSKV